MTKFVLPLLALSLSACHPTSTAQVVAKPAKLDFFIMSQCPFGVQVMKAVAPALDKLGANVDFSVNYIGTKQGDTFTSLHGPNEVQGDIAQLCAAKQAPDKYVHMMICQYQNPHEVATNWKACAKKVGIDVTTLSSCYKGPEGKKLLAASFALSQKRGAMGSPTMFLDGKPYEGGRHTRDFLRAVCNSFTTGPKPTACTNIPVPPQVAVTFFSDKRCAKCNIDRLQGRLKSDVAGAQITDVDYMTPAGKKLYADLKAKDPSFKYLPAIILGKGLQKDHDGMHALQRFIKPVGDQYLLALGGHFDPTAEICDNKIDDDGNGKIDCADPACKQSLNCRPEKKDTLDAFVMSHCPYGNKAMSAMKEVLGTFGKKMHFNVHFIGDPNHMASLHGPTEVTEDERQICAAEHYSKNDAFMKYIECRAADYHNPDWKACTGKNGINPKVIETCVTKEGKGLLKKDFMLADSLNISASPTFLANNRHTFGGIDAESIKQGFCKYNSGLAGCSKSLSTDKSVQGSCGK